MSKNTLYIIARSDLPDFNPGKLAAQAAHAQADFDEYVEMSKTSLNEEDSVQNEFIQKFCEDVEAWRDGKTFGRTVVLQATLNELNNINDNETSARLVVDPTYPWKNYYGQRFLSNEVTCAWVFQQARYETIETIADLPVHP